MGVGGSKPVDEAAFAAFLIEMRTHVVPPLLSKIHLGPVTALHVLPGLLVTASKDRDVKLWERPSMQLVSVGVYVCVHTHANWERLLQENIWHKEGQKMKVVFSKLLHWPV